MNATSVPNVIIDGHLTRANPEFIIVCLYILRWKDELPHEKYNAEKIAEVLNLNVKTVTDALIYWASAGFTLINGDNGVYQNKIKNNVTNENIRIVTVPKMENRPSYAVAEIEKYANSTDDVRFMFQMAERIYGKALTYNDMNLLLAFYDWLALPVSVIEVLLDYCVTNGKRSSRYMEKVALNWADNGITTVDEAEAYIKLFNVDYREIMKELGLAKNDPAPKEIEFMRKWLKELKMPMELVIEACGRAVIQTTRNRFVYTDGIIESWYAKNILTMEQVKQNDNEYDEKQQEMQNMADSGKGMKKKRGQAQGQSQGIRQKSRFANYKGREWNFEEMDRLISEEFKKYDNEIAAEDE
jgi:DnaD/phage-associated family protein